MPAWYWEHASLTIPATLFIGSLVVDEICHRLPVPYEGKVRAAAKWIRDRLLARAGNPGPK